MLMVESKWKNFKKNFYRRPVEENKEYGEDVTRRRGKSKNKQNEINA